MQWRHHKVKRSRNIPWTMLIISLSWCSSEENIFTKQRWQRVLRNQISKKHVSTVISWMVTIWFKIWLVMGLPQTCHAATCQYRGTSERFDFNQSWAHTYLLREMMRSCKYLPHVEKNGNAHRQLGEQCCCKDIRVLIFSFMHNIFILRGRKSVLSLLLIRLSLASIIM